jgi:hypothetical protein
MDPPVEEDGEAVVPLRIGILAGTALGSIVLSPILVFFEALIGLIALVAGGAMGAGPSRTQGRQRTAGTIISIALGLLAGPVFYIAVLIITDILD